MIKAVIFDCFGVLYRDNLDLLYDLVPIDRRMELQDIIRACDHGFISRQDYREAIAELTGKTPEAIGDIERRQFAPNQPLLDYAVRLKSRYKVGLLSNIGDETMDRLFPTGEREQLFDAFVLSSDVGVVKPAAAIFEVTAERLGMLPHECVMIDDLPKNVEGAERVGMTGILFTSNRQLEQDLERILERPRA